jgi:hypothetical protein
VFGNVHFFGFRKNVRIYFRANQVVCILKKASNELGDEGKRRRTCLEILKYIGF